MYVTLEEAYCYTYLGLYNPDLLIEMAFVQPLFYEFQVLVVDKDRFLAIFTIEIQLENMNLDMDPQWEV